MQRVVVVGAGLIGSLLSIFLARRGYSVLLFDRHPDPRATRLDCGRSINLTLCHRGFCALDRAGVGRRVRSLAVPAYGRRVHAIDGEVRFQPYGNRREAIHSISRNRLNQLLLEEASALSTVEPHFGQRCLDVDLEGPAVTFEDVETGDVSAVEADRVVGADGAYSAVRLRMLRTDRFDYSQEYLGQGYRELSVPALGTGEWALEPDAIHIWPRGHYMLIGFANSDGSFTLSLHLPFDGAPSFSSLRTARDLEELFDRSFHDALPKIPRLADDFFGRPTNSMVTIRCSPWCYEGKVLLIGDAAHAIVPSYGQGANAGFEDCAFLDAALERHGDEWGPALADYERERKPNTDAIADLSLRHFAELREHVGDPCFLLRKAVERKLCELAPDLYQPLYSRVSFTSMSYLEALEEERGRQAVVERILGRLDGRGGEENLDALVRECLESEPALATPLEPVATIGKENP